MKREMFASCGPALDAPTITRAQRALAEQHGVWLPWNAIVVRDPTLRVWTPDGAGGLYSWPLPQESREALARAEHEWEG